jgi:hypothetical protein
MLDIAEYKEKMTKEEYETIGFDRLQKIDGLRKELLEQHHIHLENARGVGYVVAEPDYQVTDAVIKAMRKVKKGLIKAANLCRYVNEAKLSSEAKQARDKNLSKVTFVMQAANKRKIPEKI